MGVMLLMANLLSFPLASPPEGAAPFAAAAQQLDQLASSITGALRS